jgi:hypothetical protein
VAPFHHYYNANSVVLTLRRQPNANRFSDRDRNGNRYCHADPDANRYSDRYRYLDSDTNRNANRHRGDMCRCYRISRRPRPDQLPGCCIGLCCYQRRHP